MTGSPEKRLAPSGGAVENALIGNQGDLAQNANTKANKRKTDMEECGHNASTVGTLAGSSCDAVATG
eukprot:4261337-Pyramimonas_sp.AAC.1